MELRTEHLLEAYERPITLDSRQWERHVVVVHRTHTRCVAVNDDSKRNTGGVGQVEMPHGFSWNRLLGVEPEYCFVVKENSSRRSKSNAVAHELSMLRSKP